jgi:hypothetical protein
LSKPTKTTTKPRSARRTARESLVRLVRDYAPVAPFLAALLATQPAPKLPEVAKPKPTKSRSGRRRTGSGG